MMTPKEWEHGKVVKNFSLAGYNFAEAVYAPKSRLSAHSHDFVYFCFVLQGNFTEVYDKKERVYSPATLIFRPSEEIHSNYFHTKSRCFKIQLSFDKFRKYADSQTLLDTKKIFENGKITHLVSRLYEELCFIDKFSALTTEGLMLEILAETFRQSENSFSNKPPRWLLQIESLIIEEFKENLTIEALARSENIHPTHLAREFRRYFNSTIGDYIRKKRVEFACQKLINSNMPIKEIAIEAGFFDQSHFTRVFKKAFNITPSAYRSIFSNR